MWYRFGDSKAPHGAPRMQMFQTAELGQKVSKKEFKEQETLLRGNLLALQQRLRRNGDFSVLLDFAGVRGAGKGSSTNLLNKWMDARWIVTHAFDQPTDVEAERPNFWRFWQEMPPRGQIGIHLSGRYSRPLLDYVYGHIDQSEFKHQLERINNFEKALADDGTMVLKFWMHISKKVQKKRLEALEQDPLRSWRMSDIDWTHYEMYDTFIEAAEQIITFTNTGHAPWEIIDGEDHYYRSLRVGEVFQEQLERHLVSEEYRQRYLEEMRESLREKYEGQDDETHAAGATILDHMRLDRRLAKKTYRKQLVVNQARLGNLFSEVVRKKIPTILVFEGPDAAGKGGCIRQITEVLDARYYKVHPFAAPTDIEKAHHYLWRFWNCVPRSGRMAIFDRSWYGRVLVERVENLASEEEWKRAYAEINDFEEQLIEHGIVLVKFWLHITSDEQLARFKARKETPHKRWKLTDEDWRNREKWVDYERAVNDMVQHTSTLNAPWTLVEGNDKRFARVKVIRTLCEQLESALNRL